MRFSRLLFPLATIAALLTPAAIEAKPLAPGVFCDTYPEAPMCLGGSPSCTLCHSESQAPPVLNPFGESLSAALSAYIEKPFSDNAFRDNLPSALADIEGADADGDGHSNVDELSWGSLPGNASSIPEAATCPSPEELLELDYQICSFDPNHAFRKVAIDFCGILPTFDEMESFRASDPATQMDALHVKLDQCLDTLNWQDRGGVLWQLASRKIRPVGGLQGFAEYENDYDYFVYTQLDGVDVREVLTGQYLVQRKNWIDKLGTRQVAYEKVDTMATQPMQPERRAGLLTSAWPLFYNTMFTALPRGTAANAYRAFLNLDIAASEGLEWGIASEPVDFDGAGVQQDVCATCHATLDPLSYPFATYNGLQSDGQATFYQYDPNRIQKYFVSKYPAMAEMPEAGYIFGKPVSDLLEWAQVAANSDQFYAATVEDYWTLLMGSPPSAQQAADFAEYTGLWQNLKDDEQHSVESMLHSFIETEAYGAP